MMLHEAAEDFDGRFVQVIGSQDGGEAAKKEVLAAIGQRGRASLNLDRYDAYTVELFSGRTLEVPADMLRAWDHICGEDGGFDVAWPSQPELLDRFSWDVAEQLVTKGFCVVQCFLEDTNREEAASQVRDLSGWKRFIQVFEADYLGRSASGKAVWLDGGDGPESQGLGCCNQLLTEASYSLEPLCQLMFGFEALGRTDGLLRAPCENEAEESNLLGLAEKLDERKVSVEGVVEEHLKFVQQRKVGMFYFLRGTKGTLTLHPKEGEEITIPCEEGHLLLFRHDRLSYTYLPEGDDSLLLQAWILSEGHGTMVQSYDGPTAMYDEATGLENGPRAPRYGFTGKSVSIVAMDCMLAMNGLGPEFFWSALSGGTDGGRHLNPVRWDPEAYFEPDKDRAIGKYYSNHAGFVLEETCLAFDNDFFGYDDSTASNMDPCQRNVLEVGYNCLRKAGWNRRTLNGAQIGVFVGNCGTDWAMVCLDPRFNPVSPEYANSMSVHTCSTRLSYLFGLRGGCSNADTACSSSLVANGSAHNALRRVEADQLQCSSNNGLDTALAIGTNGLWGPGSFIGLCGPRMLSGKGRCFTFDHSADGFGRGEGTSGITLTITDKEPSGRLAMLCGTCINQDGRSASMTAPHGPSQQECLKASMREASISPADVRVAELHGTGTALGDPIEVGALRGVMKKRDLPIAKTSAKSNIAHGEANAGMAGLVKCFTMMMHGAVPPNVHLKDLNPHIDASAYPVLFADELLDLGTSSGYAGVSSFGFGGTNARADLWAKTTIGVRATGQLDHSKLDYVTVRCARCLGWMDHVGGIAMATIPQKPQYGRFKPYCIREESATYEYCSMCYQGEYAFLPMPLPPETPLPGGKLYIRGTWNNWMEDHLVELTDKFPDQEGHFHFRLGETLMERFYYTVEKNSNFSVVPVCKRAGMEIRCEGPKVFEGNTWLIDARDERWPEGSLIQITFKQLADGSRKVTWQRLHDPPQQGPCRHKYFVSGTWTAGQMVPMTEIIGQKKHVFEYSMPVGVRGLEAFQLARDADPDQMIYPATPKVQRPDTPVRGPDHLGTDKYWVVQGKQGEELKVRIEVLEGQILVQAGTYSWGARRWQSVLGRARKCFFVRGSWLQVALPMEPEPERRDVYWFHMTMENPTEEFQVLVDEDPRVAYYPEAGGFPSGSVFVAGPDGEADGRHFQLEGDPGSTIEIMLDLSCEDKRWIVSWRPLVDGGQPFLPWAPEAKYGIRTPGSGAHALRV